MKLRGFFLVTMASLFWVSWVEGADLNQQQYSDKFALQDAKSRHWPDVEACLKQWGNHPFKDKTNIRFRIIKPDVKVFGIGANVIDNATTSYPQLIYIRPAVSVMSKTTYNLMNPNGWYCFKSKVNVMGKSVIKAACKAHIVTVKGKTTVLGEGEKEKKGTTVLGESVVERDCK